MEKFQLMHIKKINVNTRRQNVRSFNNTTISKCLIPLGKFDVLQTSISAIYYRCEFSLLH